MSDEMTHPVKEAGHDKHDMAMQRYRALDLQIDHNGTVQLTSDAQRRIFAYGYWADGGCPKHITSWKLCLEGIELLQGMGLPALSNLELLYVVNGKLTAMHRLCLAACQATGELERHHAIFVNDKNEPLSEHNLVGFITAGCVVYVRRKNQTDEAIGAFTLDDANKAGLTQRNKNWQSYGKDMLYHRASMRALSQKFADVLQGVRCKELEEMQPLLDDAGKPIATSSGHHLFQRAVARNEQAAQDFRAALK